MGRTKSAVIGNLVLLVGNKLVIDQQGDFVGKGRLDASVLFFRQVLVGGNPNQVILVHCHPVKVEVDYLFTIGSVRMPCTHGDRCVVLFAKFDPEQMAMVELDLSAFLLVTDQSMAGQSG